VSVVILLKQHIGSTCKAVVEKGEEVKRGQLIGKPVGLGANIHASVSGKITEVTDSFIKISESGEQTTDYIKIKKSDNKLAMIEEAGIVGAGGAGFPTHVKLNIDLTGGCVIANAVECEPVLAHNIELIEKSPELVIKGLKYIKEITNADHCYIAIKTKYKKAVKELKKALYLENDIKLKILPDMYPAGDERVIVREILGIELEPGQLPSAAKAVIQNVETLKNIVRAIEERKPVITKDFTVAGRVKNAKTGQVFLDVPIGEPVSKYIDLCGGYLEPHGEIVLGGPFTGRPGNEDSVVNKTTGGILVAMPFPEEKRKIGLLACECGGQEARLREIATQMGAEIVAVDRCKRMVEVNGRYRCDKPGVCPGQAEKVLKLKNKGMQVLLTGTCGD
jgi:proline reductase-associated electron transfer protein PrdC